MSSCRYPLSAASKVLCLQEHSKRALGIGALYLNRINIGEIAGAHRSMRFDLSVEETTLGAAGQTNVHLDYDWCSMTCYAHLGVPHAKSF